MTEEPTPEQIKEALDELALQDRIRTVKSCAYGCLMWILMLVGIIDLFFINIALGVLLYNSNGI